MSTVQKISEMVLVDPASGQYFPVVISGDNFRVLIGKVASRVPFIGSSGYLETPKLAASADNASRSTDEVVLIARSVNGSGTSGHAFSDSSVITRSGGVSYNSFDCRIKFEGTAPYGHYAGFQAIPEYASSGLIDDIYNVYSELALTGTGNVTNFYGMYIKEPSTPSTGRVTNIYGIYLRDLGSAATGLKYSIYSAGSAPLYQGGKAYFGGDTFSQSLYFCKDGPTIDAIVSSTGALTGKLYLNYSSNGDVIVAKGGGSALFGTETNNGTGRIQSAGNVSPSAHNTYDLGTTAVRWRDVWCQTGAFNGSDARLKTEVRPLTGPELQAAKALSKEIGTYQWLESVASKGAEKARHHVGMTVQRAIEIMQSFGLDPFAYGFIGYDKWDDTIVHHEAVEAQEATEESPAVEAVDAWDEVVLKAGDAYSFRYDQLNQFIARGLEARLTEMEARLTALES